MIYPVRMRQQHWTDVDSTNILVRLPLAAKAEIAELARRKGVSQTMLINDALFRYLQAERVLAQAERTTT